MARKKSRTLLIGILFLLLVLAGAGIYAVTVLSRPAADVDVSSILNMGAGATPVMVLGDIREVFVRGKVDEADIGLVRLNQPARIKAANEKELRLDSATKLARRSSKD